MTRLAHARATGLTAAAVLSLLPGSQSAVAQQQLPHNAVPIAIYWSTGQGRTPLTRVAFQDALAGAVPFRAEGDHFTGVREAEGSWAFHDVTLFYGSSSSAAPIALRTLAGTPGVRIDVALSGLTACRGKALTSLKNVGRQAPVGTRIETMLAARHLLDLGAAACPKWARRDLAEIYFNMSCSLAKGTSYFRVSEEAKDLMRELGRSAMREDEISNCHAETLGLAVKSMLETSRRKLKEEDFGAFERLNAELLVLFDEPLWSPGFGKQNVTQNNLRADFLTGLYRQQQRAFCDRDLKGSLRHNSRLRRLWADPAYRPAFQAVRLDGTRLESDRVYLEAGGPPTPECS